MFNSKPKCPECGHAINLKTIRCPQCKKTIPKKLLDKHQKAENLFWIVSLLCFALFLVVPLVLFDLLGSKRMGIVMISGLPISFLLGSVVKIIKLQS